MDSLDAIFAERNLLYYFAFIFIFYIVLADMMIMRAHLYIALAAGVVIAHYIVKSAKTKKIFD
ncbi:MAG: hypothetical protein ABH834_06340 [Candidatus Altiarchaeota archaeon]